MENGIKQNISFSEKLTNEIIKNKKYLFIILFLVISILIGYSYFNHAKNIKNLEISDKYIKAGILLNSERKEESKIIYKEIILSENKFYAFLSINKILDNELESNYDEIFNLFKILENLKVDKEKKNLIKLKKALFLIKISKEDEGNNLLKEIIENNSIWKSSAQEILE